MEKSGAMSSSWISGRRGTIRASMTPRFAVLPGLPGTGPLPEQFSNRGETHREGLVVRFFPSVGHPWVGNFQPFHDSYFSGVFGYPGGRELLVIAGGTAYVVDPETQRLVRVLNSFVTAAARSENYLVLASDVDITVIAEGAESVSPRLAIDGIGELRVEGDLVTANGHSDYGGARLPIEIDAATRKVFRSALPAGWPGG
jgi:hypothetical protein